MNMVNGLTMTFTTNVNLSNVEVSHIISNTGLSYGVAVWYKTHVNIYGDNGLNIHHVHAGKELAPSDEYTTDSYPNLIPEACAFRIYDDEIYNAMVTYDDDANIDDNVIIQCISGHTGCLMDTEDYSNIGYVQECDDSMITKKKKLPKSSKSSFFGTDKKGMYMIGSVIILSMAILFYHCFFLKQNIKKLVESEENTPLLLNEQSVNYN